MLLLKVNSLRRSLCFLFYQAGKCNFHYEVFLHNVCQQFCKQSRLCSAYIKNMDVSKTKDAPEILHAPGICILRPNKVTFADANKVEINDKQGVSEQTKSTTFGSEQPFKIDQLARVETVDPTVSCEKSTISETVKKQIVADVFLAGNLLEKARVTSSCTALDSPLQLNVDTNPNESVQKNRVKEISNHIVTSEDSMSRMSSDKTSTGSPEKFGSDKRKNNGKNSDYVQENIENILTKGMVTPKESVLSRDLLKQITSCVEDNPEKCSLKMTKDNEQMLEEEQTISRSVADNPAGDDKICGMSSIFQESIDTSLQTKIDGSEKRSSKRKRKREERAKADKGNQEKRQRKPPPNYFLALQVSNPVILQNVETVQQYMVSGCSDLQKVLVSVPTLHLTLMVMNLPDQDAIHRATEILNECQPFIEKWIERAPLLELSGIGHFNGAVVFVKIPDEDQQNQLQELAEHVTKVFTENGISPSDNKGFKPHITVLKLSKAPQLRKKGLRKVTSHFYEPYRESLFGVQAVESLQLCSMMKRKSAQGYYHVEHQIHGTLDVPSSTRNTPLLQLQRFPSSVVANQKRHSTTRDGQTNSVTLQNEIKWLFYKGEKLK